MQGFVNALRLISENLHHATSKEASRRATALAEVHAHISQLEIKLLQVQRENKALTDQLQREENLHDEWGVINDRIVKSTYDPEVPLQEAADQEIDYRRRAVKLIKSCEQAVRRTSKATERLVVVDQEQKVALQKSEKLSKRNNKLEEETLVHVDMLELEQQKFSRQDRNSDILGRYLQGMFSTVESSPPPPPPSPRPSRKRNRSRQQDSPPSSSRGKSKRPSSRRDSPRTSPKRRRRSIDRKVGCPKFGAACYYGIKCRH